MTNLRQMGFASAIYGTNNDDSFIGYLGQPGWGTGWFNSINSSLGVDWKDKTKEQTLKLFECPAAGDTSPIYPFGTSKAGWANRWGYGMNHWLDTPYPGQPFGGGSPPAFFNKTDFWFKYSTTQGASRVPMFLDGGWGLLWGDHRFSAPLYPDSYPMIYPGTTGHNYTMDTVCIDRHNGSVNAVFADNSARKVGLKGLWLIKWHRSFNTAYGLNSQRWPGWMNNFD